MKKMLAWSLVLTFALAAPLSAEDKPKPEKKKPDPAAQFQKLDADKDGSLSVTEFTGKRDAEKAKKAFDRKDANKDGKLSLEEFKAMPGKKPKAAK